MSRIGRKAVEIAKGASVEVKGTDIIVKGPKGELHAELMPGISVDIDGGLVKVSRANEEKQTREQRRGLRSGGQALGQEAGGRGAYQLLC